MEEIADDGLLWRVIPSESDSAYPGSMWANVYELSQVAIVHVDNGFGRASAHVCRRLRRGQHPWDLRLSDQSNCSAEDGSYQGPFHGNDGYGVRTSSSPPTTIPTLKLQPSLKNSSRTSTMLEL